MFLGGWLAASLGCAPALPEPTLEGVAPVWGWNGESTDVTVVGTNLLPSVYAYADTRGDHRIYEDFELELVDADGLVIALTGEELDTYRALKAQVPSGHPSGLYDVRVTTPAGKTAVLEGGFTVTDTRADHLSFEVEEVAFEVHQTAVLGIVLADPEGAPVGEDLAIEVRADPDQGADSASFSLKGLVDVAVLEDGVGIRGRLGSDGEAFVTVTSTEPGGLRLNVDPESEDSLIRGDEVFLDFSPGAIEGATLELPGEDFVAQAGAEFPVEITIVDVYGNTVDDVALDVWLEEECGDLRDSFTIVGSQTRYVAVTGATDTTCSLNKVKLYGGTTGESATFETTPGPASTVTLFSAGQTAVAGESFHLLLWAEDDYANVLQDFESTVTLTDTEGALASASCGEGPVRFCELVFDTATSSTILQATSDVAFGQSDPITVVAGEASVMLLQGPEGPLVAGVDFPIGVRVEDDWANGVELDPDGADPFDVDLGGEAATCTWAAGAATGEYDLSCRTTVAAEAATLTVSLPSRGLEATFADLEVVNGDLAAVALTPESSTVTAGVPFALTAVATDAWGNAYLEQTDSVIDLSEPSGTLSPASLTLLGTGQGSTDVTILAAGPAVVITASQAGVAYGTTTVTVEPAELSDFDVGADQGWTWLDEALELRITALDAHGNTVTGFTGAVTLTSTTGSFGDQVLTEVDGGVVTTSLTWTDAVVGDTVRAAADSGETGESAAIDVLDGDCGSPPVAELLLDGLSEDLVCRIGGAATVAADLSGSSGSPTVFHLDDGQGGFTRLASSTSTLQVDSEGAWVVQAVVGDDQACGGAASATLWVGDADGEPVGPVTVATAHTSRTAGSTSNGSTTVTVSATTCSGDLAAAGTLYVRADLGDFSGPAATGSGLALTLDSAGSATATWSVQSSEHAGTATLEAGTLDGASWGSGTVDVTGDSARPTVVSVDPSGTTSELLDQVVVVFTEAMSESSISTSRVGLAGDGGALAISALSLDSGGTTLTITLEETLDTSQGPTWLSLSSSLRDELGSNRLDGSWSGAASGYSSVFGAVDDDALSMVGCTPDTAQLAPDGDDGTASQRDEVDLAVSADGTPSWWLLQVRDDTDALVRTDRVVGSATTATVTWDARGDDGFVAPPGTYGLEVSTIDAQDNLSTPCATEVTLSQQYRSPQ